MIALFWYKVIICLFHLEGLPPVVITQHIWLVSHLNIHKMTFTRSVLQMQIASFFTSTSISHLFFHIFTMLSLSTSIYFRSRLSHVLKDWCKNKGTAQKHTCTPAHSRSWHKPSLAQLRTWGSLGLQTEWKIQEMQAWVLCTKSHAGFWPQDGTHCWSRYNPFFSSVPCQGGNIEALILTEQMKDR